jgi:hypothetical protein
MAAFFQLKLHTLPLGNHQAKRFITKQQNLVPAAAGDILELSVAGLKSDVLNVFSALPESGYLSLDNQDLCRPPRVESSD